jgi:hypothetical protein
MFGDLVPVATNALMVEGQRPWNILFAPDVANAVVYRRGDTLYILDTGATLFFRRRIIEAAERLRPFRRIVLLNSHGHVDHTSNNSVIHDIQADEKLHFITEVGIHGLDYDRYFRRQFGQINKYYNFLDGPSFPFSLMGTLLKVLARFNPEAPFLMVGSLLSKFPPMESLANTVVPFERRGPAQSFRFGSEDWTAGTSKTPSTPSSHVDMDRITSFSTCLTKSSLSWGMRRLTSSTSGPIRTPGEFGRP